MTDRGRDDPTILNHLADSLWLAGRGEEARRYWQLSEQLVSRMLVPRPEPADTQGGGGRNLTPAEIEEFRSIKESASTKRRAAAAGQPVHVAPQLNNPDPKPAARPDSPAKPDAPTDKTVDQ